MRAMIDRSPDGIKLHVIAHDGRESRIMDDSEGIIDVAIVSDKTGPMIATKPDGSTWVSYEDYIVITADNARLQAEVERLEELFRLAVERFNDAEKLVIHKDEQLVAMTARCKAAEEVLSCVPYRNKGIGEHNAYLPGMDEAVKEHRDIITAYDKAVNKIQGENK